MKKFLTSIITLYQKMPFKSHTSCVFIPTCSEYTKEALTRYGTFKGSFLGIKRICRCHPWQKNQYDPLL